MIALMGWNYCCKVIQNLFLFSMQNKLAKGRLELVIMGMSSHQSISLLLTVGLMAHACDVVYTVNMSFLMVNSIRVHFWFTFTSLKLSLLPSQLSDLHLRIPRSSMNDFTSNKYQFPTSLETLASRFVSFYYYLNISLQILIQ